MNFKPGDIVNYTPEQRHCREGQAVAEERNGKVILLDTFWGVNGSDRHLLTSDETSTAELEFSLGDYMQINLATHHLNQSTWSKYAKGDRRLVTAQHGLRKYHYVRHGAKPSWAQQIENAREELSEAERKAESAARQVDYTRRNLEYVIAKAEEQSTEEFAQ